MKQKVKKTQEELMELLPDLKLPLIAFSELAKKYNYKDIIPSLPQSPNPETMRGFYSRFYNWKGKLLHRVNEIKGNQKASLFSRKALGIINNNLTQLK